MEGYIPGRCVTFHECPPLKGLLRSSSLTAAELKLLQNLTCTIDPENPTICCALKDIPDLTNYNEAALGGKFPSKLPSSEDIIIYPVTGQNPDANNLVQIPLRPNPENGDSIGGSDRFKLPVSSGSGEALNANSNIAFRNFKLLPKLDECGLPAVESSLRIVGGKNAE